MPVIAPIRPPLVTPASREWIIPREKPRVFYVDMIRSCAALLVLVSHVFAPICAGMNDYSLGHWWFFNLFDSVIRPSASLFVMVSGALFLGSSREEPYLQFIKRRFSRVVGPFFAWSMIYAALESHMQGKPFSGGQAVLQFLQGPTEYHLWFMYLILSLYLITPLLRRFAQAASASEIRMSLVIWLGFLTLQFVWPQLSGTGPGGALLNYGGFFILGYLLDKTTVSRDKLFSVAMGWMAAVLLCAGATFYLTVQQDGTLDEKFFGGATPLVVLEAAAAFLMLRYADGLSFFQRPWPRRIISSLSRESYNIYLIHPFFIWVFMKGFLGFTISQDTGPNPLIGVILTSAAVLACSFGLTFLLKKIPLVSKLLVLS